MRGLFKSYGEVLDVVAHDNLRMRGQAFVSFTSPEIAKKALKEVRGFPLYSKPMVRLRFPHLRIQQGSMRTLSSLAHVPISKSRLRRHDRTLWCADSMLLTTSTTRRSETSIRVRLMVLLYPGHHCANSSRGDAVQQPVEAKVPREAHGLRQYVHSVP